MRIKSLEDLLTAYEGAYPGDVAHTGTLPERRRLGYVRMNPEMPRVWADAAQRHMEAARGLHARVNEAVANLAQPEPAEADEDDDLPDTSGIDADSIRRTLARLMPADAEEVKRREIVTLTAAQVAALTPAAAVAFGAQAQALRDEAAADADTVAEILAESIALRLKVNP